SCLVPAARERPASPSPSLIDLLRVLRATSMIRHALRTAPVLAIALISLCAAGTAQAGLDDYVRRDDKSFTWRVLSNHTSPAGKVHTLKITSQVWQGITWEHQLQIFEPAQIRYPDAALLFITGGSVTSKPGPGDVATGFELARLCGAR